MSSAVAPFASPRSAPLTAHSPNHIGVLGFGETPGDAQQEDLTLDSRDFLTVTATVATVTAMLPVDVAARRSRRLACRRV